MTRRSDGVTTHDGRMHVSDASTDGRPEVTERPSLSADGLATLLDTRWYLVVTGGELYRPDAVEPFAPLF